jgi:DNA-binding transcriptional LysR family regulator
MGTGGFRVRGGAAPPAGGAAKPQRRELRQHRAVAVADSVAARARRDHNLLPGQDVLTVPTMQHKLEAQLRGLGCGFLPQPLAQPYIDAGLLVAKPVQRPDAPWRVAYAWRVPRGPGREDRPRAALVAGQLRQPAPAQALLENHQRSCQGMAGATMALLHSA